MPTRKPFASWTFRIAVAACLATLAWIYPLTYLRPPGGHVPGELCVDKYGIPSVYLEEGLQPEQVHAAESWSRIPPGWDCTFASRFSQTVVTVRPGQWRAWAAGGSAFFLVVSTCVLVAGVFRPTTRDDDSPLGRDA